MVGSQVTLDQTGSYPTGLLAALSPYNIPAELVNAQLRFAATQEDKTASEDAGYANRNVSLETSGTVIPDSYATQVAAINYIDASLEVNYANQNTSNSANIAYTNARAVAKACRDASYCAFLTYEAAQLVETAVAEELSVIQLGNTSPIINPVDTPTLSTISTLVGNVDMQAHNKEQLAINNRTNYYLKTTALLNNAQTMSYTVSRNLVLVAAINTLTRWSAKALAYPLSTIAGKELLVTQYVPSVPLTAAINVVNAALASLNSFLSAISQHVLTSVSITATVNAAKVLADTLDTSARADDTSLYFNDFIANQVIATTSTLKGYGAVISIPNIYPNNPVTLSKYVTDPASASRKIANDSDISADNARGVSDALLSLKTAFSNTITQEPIIVTTVKNSISVLNELLTNATKVTSNSSSYAAVAITRRASNSVTGILNKQIEIEHNSLDSASDAMAIYTLILAAENTLIPPTTATTFKTLWAVNAATDLAEKISEKAKDRAYILSRTAHNLVTSQNIAIQTAAANRAGALRANYASKLDRNSRNVFQGPPPAYNSFKADLRAKALYPMRSMVDELVLQYKVKQLPILAYCNTIEETAKKLENELQKLKDVSAFSYRQQ